MKALLLIASAMISLTGTAAFAAGCVEGNRSLFQEPRGNDKYVSVWRTCVNGRYYPKSVTKGTPCKEGATSIFYENIPNTDHQKMVVRTCVDGRYYPKTEAKILKCAEGRRQVFSESDGNDHQIQYWTTCINGKYVRD